MQKFNNEWPYNDYATGYDKIDIKYGEFHAEHWYAIGGIKHPLFRYLVDRINYRTLMHHEIHVLGGVLEPWLSWDVDILLIGPYDPEILIKSMNAIVFSGFEVGLYCDVAWTTDVRPIESLAKEWKAGSFEPLELFRVSNRFEKDGKVIRYTNFEEVDGLYKQTWWKPPEKCLDMKRDGYVYQPPMRIK